jgi:hypothetical protein
MVNFHIFFKYSQIYYYKKGKLPFAYLTLEFTVFFASKVQIHFDQLVTRLDKSG